MGKIDWRRSKPGRREKAFDAPQSRLDRWADKLLNQHPSNPYVARKTKPRTGTLAIQGRPMIGSEYRDDGLKHDHPPWEDCPAGGCPRR